MSARQRFVGLVALGAAALAAACGAADGGPTGVAARSINGADAAPIAEAGVACGAVTAVGCCEGEALFWCAEGVLRRATCVARERCGWREARGFYDCDTAGSADPTGHVPMGCDWGDGGPPVDLGAPDLDGGCGPVTVEGCCAGEVLLFCDRGRMRAISCAQNPTCGWRGRAQYYECGTAGDEDPGGVHPRACPVPAPDVDRPPGDAAAGRPGAAADAGADVGTAGAAAPAASGAGCACSASAVAPARALGPLLLLLLLARLPRGASPR